MKPTKYILLPGLFLSLFTTCIFSQENFNPDVYKSFLENNNNFTTAQLMEANPHKTIYYSDRQEHTNLDNVAWFDSINQHYHLTGYEKALISKNHFMVTERLKNASWAYAFIDIYSNDLPLFISSDFVLHSLHQSYNSVLKYLEVELLEPNLIKLLGAMYNKYEILHSKYKDDANLAAALGDVDLYVSVAYSLALNDTILPHFFDETSYYEVIDEIKSEKMTTMTLFTDNRMRKIDFSQFKPRGHYTENIYTSEGIKNLENYFRAMTWLGRIDFLLTAPPSNPWEEDWKPEELQRMQAGALLLNELLNSCGSRDLLELHEKIITYLVGPDDNLTPDELSGLADRLLSSPADIYDNEIYLEFTDSLNSSDDYGQKIMSNFFYVDPSTTDPGNLPVSFKLLGQKFLLDSYITAEVVYDRIVWNGKKIHRDLPDPLDVLSVLGNENAMELMKEEMETYHYAYKINELKELVSYYDDDFWEQSLYNTWLSSIKTLNPPSYSDNMPYFMQTTAWHHEKLNTQLASWAELRHDNILYGKQSYTGGTGCSFPYTYIEPYPDLYNQIQVFANNASSFFNEILGPDDRVTSFFAEYANIMGKFKKIAEKELSGTAFNDDDITFLKTMINNMMASGPFISGWYNDLFFDPVKGLEEDFIVADIHTQPTDKHGNVVGHIYHVGTGFMNMGVFLAPNPVNPGQLMAFTGPVSSFMYEVTKDFFRYTDDEWKENLWSNASQAKRPDWVAEYLASENGEALPEGRKLKGTTYLGTGIEYQSKTKNLDYMIAFPNPATDIVHLRFILNQSSNVTIELFDLKGSLLNREYHGNLSPSEHDIPFNLSHLPKGNYLIRVLCNGESIIKKVQIK